MRKGKNPEHYELAYTGVNDPALPLPSEGSHQGNLLRHAVTLVENDRNATYGEPHEDFARTVGQLNALGYRGPGGRPLQPRDWAVMQNASKQSRLVHSPHHHDSIADTAGYAGCYWDCVVAEQEAE